MDLEISLKKGLGGEAVAEGPHVAPGIQMPPAEPQQGGSQPPSPDKSMLPGHSTTSLLTKLAETRAKFRATQKTGLSADTMAAMGMRRPVSATRNLGSAGGTRASDPGPVPARAPGERPRAYSCYLCGCQFGSASLMIHIQACQKKWLAVEAQKPPRERRPLPPPPPEIAAGQLPGAGRAADEFNQAMTEYWDQNSLMGCPICGRTFRPEAFEKHQKVCTPDRPGGPLGMGPRGPPAGKAAVSAPSSPGGGAGKARAPSARGAAGPRSGGPGSGGSNGSGGGGLMSKPRAYTCYLCGQGYGSQCQKKWLMVEGAKPAKERRPLPPPPPLLGEIQDLPTDAAGIDAFNAAMSNHWNTVSLMGCPICGRTFRPEAFEKHQKVCTPDNPGGPLGMPKGAAAAMAAATAARAASARGGGAGPRSGGSTGSGGGNYDSRPRAYVCYLCGQQFGSKSLHIHIPQCYEKWLKVEANKDPKERREPPPPPAELDDPLPTTSAEIDAFNQRMSDLFNGVSLMKCQHCGRTMKPEALTKHQKLCTADSPMKGGGLQGTGGGAGAGAARAAGYTVPSGPGSGGSGSGGAPTEYAAGPSEDLAPCQHCGRRMRAEALVKHHKVCTADKPMKSVRPTASPSASAGGSAPPSAGTSAPASPMRPSPPPRPPQGAAPPESPTRPSRLTRPSAPASTAPMQPGHEEEEPQEGAALPQGQYSLPEDLGGATEAAEDESGRVECGSCGRRFAPDALEKHSRICAKVFATKRKPFNMAKQRLAGTDAAPLQRSVKTPPSRAPAAAPAATSSMAASSSGGAVPRWKAQSQELRNAMANMRAVAAAQARGEDIRNIPVQYSAPDPSYIQCPHCSRRFNPKAAERHISSCANTSAKPKFLKAGTGGSGQGAPQSRALPKW